MQYSVSLSEDGAYVRIHVHAPITGALAREFVEKAIDVARQNQTMRYLVDVRKVPNIASPTEQYQLGHEDVKHMALDLTSRISILVDPLDTSHDFIETVFQNAFYNCRLFDDKTTALQWLMK